MVSAQGSPWINRGRALRTRRKRPILCMYVCVCVWSSYMPLSICVRAFLCVCVWGSLLRWGEGKLFFKPWIWLTGAFPRWVQAVFVLHGIKTSLWGKTRGTITYTKQHHTLCCPLFVWATRLSPQCICSNSTSSYAHLSPTCHPQSTACNVNWQPKEMIVRETPYEYGEQVLFHQVFANKKITLFTTACWECQMGWVKTSLQCKQCQVIPSKYSHGIYYYCFMNNTESSFKVTLRQKHFLTLVKESSYHVVLIEPTIWVCSTFSCVPSMMVCVQRFQTWFPGCLLQV